MTHADRRIYVFVVRRQHTGTVLKVVINRLATIVVSPNIMRQWAEYSFPGWEYCGFVEVSTKDCFTENQEIHPDYMVSDFLV